MSAFYPCLAMLFLPIIIVGEISVTREKTKILDHGPFSSTTAKFIDNRVINQKYPMRNSTDIQRPKSSRIGRLKRKIDSRNIDFNDDRKDLINHLVFSSQITNQFQNLFDARNVDDTLNEFNFRKLTRRKQIQKKPSSALSKHSINRGFKPMINNCENEASFNDNAVDCIYPENENWHSIRKKILSRSFVKKRNKKNVIPKNDDYEITEVYFPTLNNNQGNDNKFREPIDHNRREFSMENETKEFYLSDANPKDLKNPMQDTITRLSSDYHESDQFNFTEIPWPIVPGPITCELDYELQPSFVARLGEFDYVVSLQRQENPDEPAEHTCTGVIYNRRFVIIAPHCVNDNYGISVTSTDDLCTIDEMIDVDYIIEHKNYDSDTRTNDIALLKLKSEIHNKAAKFPTDDDTLDTYFYAVGFGELMWNSFPTKVSKLLQKVPVQRYTQDFQEAPGTLHVTTSLMDLTGTFRGDYGGALINPKGEFVGLKSRLIKKSTEYEVYTKVRDYLPWIKSMVALHGS